MGVLGLTTFINTQYWIYDKYELHDTKVVIDGNNLYHFLFQISKNASFFGGDFEDFIFHTETFFKQLELCKIVPLIIFDGAGGDNKLEVLKKNYKHNVVVFCGNTDAFYSSCISKKITFAGVLLEEIFMEILDKMNIKYTRSLYEADDDIAAVAKILGCPVISMDSDFFIYNNDYIPLKKIRVGFEQGQTPGSYVKQCRLFKPHFFHRVHPNLDLSTLPLLSTLLGNDYCSQDFFTEFYDHIKGQTDLEDDPFNVNKIRLVFNWLENKSFYQAIDQLFLIMPKEKHEKMLDVMEHIFGILKIFPVGLLRAIDFPQEEIEKVSELRKKEQRSILEPFYHKVSRKEKEGSDDSQKLFYDEIPEWLREELYAGRHERTISSIITDEIIMHRMYPQNYISLPFIRCITHPIMTLIRNLVTKGVMMEYKPFTYFGHSCHMDEEDVLVIRFKPITIECREIIPPENLPSVHELRDLSFKERKVIMDEALGVTQEMKLERLSKPWQLYVGALFYWLKEDIKPKRNKFHLYATVFLILKSVVDTKLKGREESWRRSNARNLSEKLTMDISLENAISEVSVNDCWTVRKFIDERSGEDSQPREFEKVKINNIHIYNMFQYCLKDLISLNKILGNVYENPSLRYLLSGTLFYNLCEDFRGRVNIDMHIEEMLQNAPSLLRVFKLVMKQLKKMCDVSKLEFFVDKRFAPVMTVSQSVPSSVPRNMFFPFKK